MTNKKTDTLASLRLERDDARASLRACAKLRAEYQAERDDARLLIATHPQQALRLALRLCSTRSLARLSNAQLAECYALVTAIDTELRKARSKLEASDPSAR